jgi:hypothetical protein
VRSDQIEIFYLPSYAPGLNPDVRVNAGLKHAIGARVAVPTKTKVSSAAEAHIRILALKDTFGPQCC